MMTKTINDQCGFALTGFVILLPFLITAFAVLAAGYLTIMSDAKARHVCRVELLNSQQKVSDKLNALIRLNPKARALRQAREEAEEMVKAGVETGPGEIYLVAKLNAVIATQTLFAIKQKQLIAEASYESHAGPLRANRVVLKALGDDQSTYREEGTQPAVVRSSSRTADFEVEASPQESITPDYNPKSDFERTQNMQVSWNVRLLPFLPHWLTSFINMNDLNLKADCSATLIKGENQWIQQLQQSQWSPRLNAGKSSSNLW